MNDETKTPTDPNPDENHSTDGDVDPNEVKDTANDENDTAAKSTSDPAKTGDDEKKDEQKLAKPQSREQDHIEAEKRRAAKAQAEQEAKEKEIARKATFDATVETLGGVNPFTKKPIVDEYDLKLYNAQKELDKRGKDPINDLPEYLVQQEREERKKAEAEKAETERQQKESQAKIQSEITELRTAYPDVDTVKLAQDPDFQSFLENKSGRWTLKEIYEGFIAKKQSSEKPADTQQPIAKPSAPSSVPNGNKKPKSTNDMSDEEFLEYRKETYGN